MSDPTPAEALKAERIEHLRNEIYRCECVIEKGAPDSWWREDLARLKQELDILTRPPAALSPPDAGDVRTYREGVEDAALLADDYAACAKTQDDAANIKRSGYTNACTELAAAIRKLP